MAKVRGLDHFTKYFAGFESEFVIVGGSAASVLMEDNELGFRATKDIDLIILSHPSTALVKKLIEYIKSGGYAIKYSNKGLPKYYRYEKPKLQEFPQTLEIFSRNQEDLELEDGQHIIPIPADSSNRLSAILLDDEYFSLIKNHSLLSVEGHSIVDHIGNICLKARAFRDLSNTKAQGGAGDSRDINKHRNDIMKIALTIPEGTQVSLSGQPKADLESIVQEIENIEVAQFNNIMTEYVGATKAQVLSILKKTFI